MTVAVMMEAGWDEVCDVVLFVDVERKIRMKRAMSRGWSQADFTARESAQENLNSKRDRADVVIDNNGDLESTRAQVVQFWQGLETSS